MKQFFASLLLVSSLVMAGCAVQEVVEYRYIYADGSGNAYRVSETQLEYDPVKPLESSSGIYDGGEAATWDITTDQFVEIESAIQSAVGNTDSHIPNREMMSGSITVVDGEERTNVILTPKSEEKEVIEEILSRIKSQE